MASVLLAGTAAQAQYVPPQVGICGSGFIYSARVCVPRQGPANVYTPPSMGICATGFTYSAKVCVPWLTDTSPRALAAEQVSAHWVGREP